MPENEDKQPVRQELAYEIEKILVLAGKSAPKIIREDPICELAVR